MPAVRRDGQNPFGPKIGDIPTKALRQGACAQYMAALDGLMQRVADARCLALGLHLAQKTLALHRFAHHFTRQVAVEKSAQGWLDFDDLIRRTAELLEESSMAQWVLWRLDGGIDHILVDEAQFLRKPQVWQLSEVVDALDIPVLCYGLRTDFRGELFEGSQYLLAWADEMQEIKTICHSGKKATMTVRVDEHGHAVQDGPQVEIGGNDRYVSVSRAEFKKIARGEGRIEPMQAPLPW